MLKPLIVRVSENGMSFNEDGIFLKCRFGSKSTKRHYIFSSRSLEIPFDDMLTVSVEEVRITSYSGTIFQVMRSSAESIEILEMESHGEDKSEVFKDCLTIHYIKRSHPNQNLRLRKV